MALPEEVATVNLTGTYVNLDGTPTVGYLMFEPSPQILKAADSREFVVPKVMQVNLDENGAFSIQLPANDDPDVEPLEWTYSVTEAFGARRVYSIEIHVADGPTQNIYDLAPVARSNGTFYEQGDRGPAGPPALITTGKPADTVGVDGDHAIDVPAGMLYTKTGSSWDNGTRLGGTAAVTTPVKTYIDNADAADQLYSDGKLSAHANTSSGTHGVVGILVGTTDTQTLSNKILSAPSVTGGLSTDTLTTTGVATVASLKVNGALDATGQTITAAHVTVSSAPSAGTDAATKSYVDTASALAVKVGGDIGGTAAAPTVTGGTHHTHTSAQISDATASATASTVVLRDASANATLNQLTLSQSVPQTASQATRKDYVDNHTWLSASITDATSAATASMIAKRDAAGRLQVVDPSVAADVATKNYVDSKVSPVTSVAGKTGVVTLVSADITDATNAATASTLAKRDANGGLALSYQDTTYAATPASPASGVGRVYLDTTYHGWAQVGSDGSVRYGQTFWGAGTAFPAATYLKAGDTYRRTDIGTNGSVFQYTGNSSAGSAGWIAEGSVVCTSTTRPTVALYTGLEIFETDTSFSWIYNATLSSWLPLTPGACTGKAWRTSGQSAVMTINTEIGPAFMEASRVSGGFSYLTASNQFVVPMDGLYDLTGAVYIEGGTGQVNAWVVRVRTSVANLNLAVMGPQNKASTQDYQPGFFYPKSPLKAGDKLSMSIYPYASGLSYYGVNETQGTFLSVTWVAPLNGATPL